jgi:hypothetical protein
MTDENLKPEIIDLEADDVRDLHVDDIKPPLKAKRTSSRNFLAAAAIAAILAGVSGAWIYRDLLANYLPNDQLQSMTARIDAMEANSKSLTTKLDAVVAVTDEIKSQLAAAQTAAEDADKHASGVSSEFATTKLSLVAAQTAIAKTNALVDELRNKLANGAPLAGQPDTSALAARVENLEKDFASLKQLGAAQITDNTVLSQSLADLKAKIAAGVSYSDEFPRVQRLIPAAEGLDVLNVYAAQGLPNSQGLAQELKIVALALPELNASPEKVDDSWWGSASSMMSQLITVKVAETPDWRQLASQSIELAAQGELAKSVATLEQPETALPIELQKWHDRAVSRIALEAALEKTSSAVLRQIAAKG